MLNIVVARLLCSIGVHSLFTKTNCERTAIDDMLGVQEGVTDQNILQYLGIIEARTNQLLLTHAYLIKHKVCAVRLAVIRVLILRKYELTA